MGRSLRTLLALVPAFLAACASVLGVDGVDYAQPDAATGDGTTTDAPGTDVSNPSDGGGGGDAFDADARRWCEHQDTGTGGFCDDFDDPMSSPGAAWEQLPLPVGGSLGRASISLSPPGALEARLAVGDAAALQYTAADVYRVLHQAASTYTSLTYELAVDLDPFPAPSDYFFIASLVYDDAQCITSGSGKQRSIELGIDSSPTQNLKVDIKGFKGACDAGGDFQSVIFPVTLGYLQGNGAGQPHWAKIGIRVDQASCTGKPGSSLHVSVDGTPQLPECIPLAVDPTTKSSNLEIHAGLSAGQPHGTTQVVYDNVLVRIE